MAIPPEIHVGDYGYEYFHTSYGPPSYEVFIVTHVNKTRKTIVIRMQNTDNVTLICTWRKTQFVPKGRTSNSYRCYNIYFGQIPQTLIDFVKTERSMPY